MLKARPILASALLAAGALLPTAAAAPVLEPTAQKFLDGLAGSKPIYTLTPDQMRGVLHGAQSGAIEKPAVDAEDRTLAVGPSGKTKVRVVKPPARRARCPGSSTSMVRAG